MDARVWLRMFIALVVGAAAAWLTSLTTADWYLQLLAGIVAATAVFVVLDVRQTGRPSAWRWAAAVSVGALLSVLVLVVSGVQYVAAVLGVVGGMAAFSAVDMSMTRSWTSTRVTISFVVFLAAAYLGLIAFGDFGTGVDPGSFFNSVSADSFALILAVAMLIGGVVYFTLEYLQTGKLASIASQFGLRTFVLMPVGIAINIVLGATVANAIKLPIYLDSIGTILVGLLAGPIPGALTGFLSNVLWTYVPPPFQYGPAAAFAVVATVIGLLAGLFGRIGALRPRPNRPASQLLAAGAVALLVVGAMVTYAYTRFYSGADQIPVFNPDNTDPLFIALGWLIVALVALAAIGFIALLLVRRDLTVPAVALAGVVTGGVAALMSAPIAANVFGGVTGSGVDLVVAAFRQAGSDIQTATLQQGLLVDPFDKMLSYFVVYLILQAMATRFKARFPQGERLVPEPPGEAPA
jgi:energy-coupling factor transport system substrate-specific component